MPTAGEVRAMTKPPKDEVDAQEKVKAFPSVIKTTAVDFATKTGKAWGAMNFDKLWVSGALTQSGCQPSV